MAQHDYNLANDNGQNFRSDANAVLEAIVSNNSGLTEPSTTFAYQFWADTTTALLKIRNSANSAWVTIGSLGAGGLGLLSLAGGTMTGALLAAAGLVGTPGISFASDADTGFYRISADKFAAVVGGVAVMIWDAATYVQMPGTAAVLIPIGTTAQRPTGTNGLLRFNSDTGKFEGYAGGLWKDVGGGGGGAGFKWGELGGLSPLALVDGNENIYSFETGLAQELYASVKVPQNYAAGTQIFLYVSAYSVSSSNTILLQSIATLIKKDADSFQSTTNQRTSTNSALTNTVASMLREFALDLTDSSGQINGQAVGAGDVIKIKLVRGTDTDTSNIQMLPNGSDVKFS